jgi:DNA phosphorothioation-dependent restriction protein DptG
VETLSEGAREVIREKISEEVRRQYLEVTWTWFEQEALPDYLHHREQSLWERYERRIQEAPSDSREHLREEWKEALADHLRREEKWLRKMFEKSTSENIEETVRNLVADSHAGELRNILDNLKAKNALDGLLTDLRKLWAEQFQPT